MEDLRENKRRPFAFSSFSVYVKMLGVYLAVFILFECVFRVLCFSGLVKFGKIDHEKIIHKYAQNPKLIYDMKPSFEMMSSHLKEIKTNRYGMRDYEYLKDKPQGVYRIAIVGDSLAFGTYLEHDLTFAKIFERKLNQIKTAEVLNFSVSGYNAYQEEIVLKEKVPPFDPDLVIVAYCLNDDSYTDGLGKLSRQTAPAALGPRLHSKLLTFILYRIEKTFFSKHRDPKKVEQLFRSLEEESKKHGYETLALIFPYKYTTMDEYDEIKKHQFVQELLSKYDIKWIDFLDVWRNRRPEEREKLYMTDDKVHLSRSGMADVGEKLYQCVLNACMVEQ